MRYLRGSAKDDSEGMTANPSKYPQGYFKDKPCRLCGDVFQPQAPSHLYCGDDCSKEAFTRTYLEKTYGITLEQFEFLYDKQNGLCAICGLEGFKLHPKQNLTLNIDHCHGTGDVRGLLCHNCNRGLGLFQDSVENLTSAINYLEGATTTVFDGYTSSEREWKRTTRGKKA